MNSALLRVMSARDLDSYWKRMQHGIGWSTAALATLLPSAAYALDPTVGVGVFVGYNVRRAGVEWGLETFATLRPTREAAPDAKRFGVGPLFQLGIAGLSDPRYTLAIQGGGELERSVFALTGELGVTYREGARSGFGLHVGLVSELALINLAFRYQFLLDEAWAGVGARLMPTYGRLRQEEYVPQRVSGRPLRAEHGRVELMPLAADGGSSDLHEMMGNAWQRDAQHEYASIPAFIQLAYELSAVRAPSALVARAFAAARDEAAHAHGCAALASHHLQRAVTLSLPTYAPRPMLINDQGLVRLAVESWADGCLGEGRAAQQAARAAELAPPGAAQQLQRCIAADEHRHAELAWDTLAWALTQAPEPVRAALCSVRDGRPLRTTETEAPPALERFGRVCARELDAVAEQHAAESSKRLSSLLAAC